MAKFFRIRSPRAATERPCNTQSRGRARSAAQGEAAEPPVGDGAREGDGLAVGGVLARAVLDDLRFVVVVLAAGHARQDQLAWATELHRLHPPVLHHVALPVLRNDLRELGRA